MYSYKEEILICKVIINDEKVFIPIRTTDPEDFENFGWFLWYIREYKVKYTTDEKEAWKWAEEKHTPALFFYQQH